MKNQVREIKHTNIKFNSMNMRRKALSNEFFNEQSQIQVDRLEYFVFSIKISSYFLYTRTSYYTNTIYYTTVIYFLMIFIIIFMINDSKELFLLRRRGEYTNNATIIKIIKFEVPTSGKNFKLLKN